MTSRLTIAVDCWTSCAGTGIDPDRVIPTAANIQRIVRGMLTPLPYARDPVRAT